MTENKKYLIVNADDFGIDHGVNKAVLEGYLKGCITSASLVSVSGEEAFSEAIDIALAYPGLDVGVHIVLTSDVKNQYRALGRAVKISRGGIFYQEPYVWAFVLQKHKHEVIEEMRMQVEKILRRGIKPSHINSHYYSTELPLIADALLSVAKEYGIKYVRNPREDGISLSALADNPCKALKALTIRFLAQHNRRRIVKESFNTSDFYRGVSFSGNFNAGVFMRVLKQLQPGLTELLVHPSFENSAFFSERAEFEAVIDPAVLSEIKKREIVLTNFRKGRAV